MMNNVNPQPPFTAETPYTEETPTSGVHPLVDRALTSALAWALGGTVAGLVGVSALMGALGKGWDEIMNADMFLVAGLFLLVASYFIFHLLRLNAQAFAMVVMAVVEVVWRRELARRAEAEARLVLMQPSPPPVLPSGGTAVVTEIINTNRAPNAAVTMVGKVAVLNEDIATFLWRAYESNGQPGKGLTREYWIGKTKDGVTLVAPFVFPRRDGSSKECDREYFEALVDVVDKRLHLIEGRKSGNEGKLRESPERVLTQMAWI